MSTGDRDLEFFYVYAADWATDERTRYTYPAGPAADVGESRSP